MDIFAKISLYAKEGGYRVAQSSTATLLELQLPVDQNRRGRTLLITVERETIENTQSLQLLSLLPFKIEKKEFIWETLRVVNFYNVALPSPLFALHEETGILFLRYTLFQPGKNLSKRDFLSLLNKIVVWIDSAGYTIEQAAKGRSLPEALQLSFLRAA